MDEPWDSQCPGFYMIPLFLLNCGNVGDHLESAPFRGGRQSRHPTREESDHWPDVRNLFDFDTLPATTPFPAFDNSVCSQHHFGPLILLNVLRIGDYLGCLREDLLIHLVIPAPPSPALAGPWGCPGNLHPLGSGGVKGGGRLGPLFLSQRGSTFPLLQSPG